jgi:hypothetical protein
MQYNVAKMRVIFPKGKVAERNPDRFATVYGVFHNSKGEKLSINSKAISREDALDPSFALDISAGTLTLPDGQRGRTAAVGADAKSIADALAALRNPSNSKSK